MVYILQRRAMVDDTECLEQYVHQTLSGCVEHIGRVEGWSSDLQPEAHPLATSRIWTCGDWAIVETPLED